MTDTEKKICAHLAGILLYEVTDLAELRRRVILVFEAIEPGLLEMVGPERRDFVRAVLRDHLAKALGNDRVQ